jgi:hypothetical protein
MGWQKTLTIIGGIITIVAAVAGTIIFAEDRFVNETEAVVSIHQQQQATDIQLLELWREQKRDIVEQMEAHPGEQVFVERAVAAAKQIERIENRLFKPVQ